MEPQRPWSEVAQEDARTLIYSNGKLVRPGDHPVELAVRHQKNTRWRRRRAKLNANVGLMRLLFRAVREELRQRRERQDRPIDL